MVIKMIDDDLEWKYCEECDDFYKLEQDDYRCPICGFLLDDIDEDGINVFNE